MSSILGKSTIFIGIFIAVLAILIGYPHPKLDIERTVRPMLLKYARHNAEDVNNVDDAVILKDVIIVITGATSGIGYAITELVCQYGGTVIALGRSIQALQKLQHQYPNQILPYPIDQSNLQSVAVVAKAIMNNPSIPYINILLNNAGIHAGTQSNNFESNTPNTNYDNVFVVNYLSHVLLTEILVDKLQPSKNDRSNNNKIQPRIVQVTSSYHWGGRGSVLYPIEDENGTIIPLAARPGSYIGHPTLYGQQSYSASKLAQIYHTRALRTKHPVLAPNKVPIVCVCPMWVGTNIARFSSIGTALLKAIAFPVNGYGISSTLHAMFDTIPIISPHVDFIGNVNIDVLTWIDESKYSIFRLPMVFDVVVNQVASFLLFTQKFLAKTEPQLTSPISYNMTIAHALYDWSVQAITEYL